MLFKFNPQCWHNPLQSFLHKYFIGSSRIMKSWKTFFRFITLMLFGKRITSIFSSLIKSVLDVNQSLKAGLWKSSIFSKHWSQRLRKGECQGSFQFKSFWNRFWWKFTNDYFLSEFQSCQIQGVYRNFKEFIRKTC